MAESERQKIEREMRIRESLEENQRKKENAKTVIRGASAGLGAWLAWQFNKKDTRTEEQKRKDDEQWEKSGCKKGCNLAFIVFMIMLLAQFIKYLFS